MKSFDSNRWRERRTLYLGLALAAVAILLAADVWTRLHSRSPATSTQPSEAGEKERKPGEAAESTHVEMEPLAQRNVGLTVVPAETRSVIQTLQVTGTVGPNETRVGHIRAITRGRVLKVFVRLGDEVRSGQTLATYDNIELGETIGQYGVGLAELEKAQTGAEVAKRSLERARNLVALGAVAQAEVERRNAEHANALSAINTQRAELARIEEKMHRFGLSDADIKRTIDPGEGREHREVSQTILKASFSGVITKYDIAEGEIVDTDRELFTIADLSTVWVQADLYEKDIAIIRKNLPVKIVVDAYPHDLFTGRITYISDLLDPKTRTAKVRCEVSNPTGRLKLDMFATISIPTPQGRSAVMVPSAGVQQINDQPVVFVRVAPSEFDRRRVTLGVREGDWVEVSSNVKPGEMVVAQGSFALKATLLREQIGEKE